jgi:hypothetical protein
VDEILRATFRLMVRSNKFDSLTRVTEFFLDLDLNVVGGNPADEPIHRRLRRHGPRKFTLQTLDAGKTSLALSDGYRCQYNDPFGPNSNSPGNTECFLGFVGDPAAGVNDWHIQKFNAANCNSGRSYTGRAIAALGNLSSDRDDARAGYDALEAARRRGDDRPDQSSDRERPPQS